MRIYVNEHILRHWKDKMRFELKSGDAVIFSNGDPYYFAVLEARTGERLFVNNGPDDIQDDQAFARFIKEWYPEKIYLA